MDEALEILDEIKIGAAKLNDMLKLGLTEETYIKTKGYKTSKKFFEKEKHRLDPKKIKRIKNDVSFNWSQKTFSYEANKYLASYIFIVIIFGLIGLGITIIMVGTVGIIGIDLGIMVGIDHTILGATVGTVDLGTTQVIM